MIVGPNAVGKTSSLEAIYLCAMGESFRANQLSDLIKKETHGFFVELQFEKHSVSQRIALGYQPDSKRVTYNQTNLTSFHALTGILHTVLLTPDDISLVKGPPQGRRRFLDFLISQADPLYLHHLTRYQRALKQRNALLKRGNAQVLSPFEEVMAVAADYITRSRANCLHQINGMIQGRYERLTKVIEPLSLTYLTKAPLEGTREYFLEEFLKLRPRELALGSTLTGPHKDDFLIELEQRDARHFASEGQQRSCVAALRLAEWDFLKEQVEVPPIFLADDIGISLDERRLKCLYEQLEELGQVILTTARPLKDPFAKSIPRMIELAS